jgi:hypothetical protein
MRALVFRHSLAREAASAIGGRDGCGSRDPHDRNPATGNRQARNTSSWNHSQVRGIPTSRVTDGA